MSKKKSMVLGYTRTGIEVCLPTCPTPDPAYFAGWTRGDHVDASRILLEHGEREADEQAGSWCTCWGRAHRATARLTRSYRVRGAAETAILTRGIRRGAANTAILSRRRRR